jgi:hypothetical protein
MGALFVIAALLALSGVVGLALSSEGRTAFPSFLVVAAVAGAGRLLGVLFAIRKNWRWRS